MSGLIRGKIECYFASQNASNAWEANAQVMFKNLFDYFTSHPNYGLISLYYGVANATYAVQGSIGGSGAGTGYFDAVGSFGVNAWFVVRANATAARPYDVYHLFQWCGVNNRGSPQYGTSAGTTALIQGSNNPNNNAYCYVGHQAAIGIGGTGGSSLSPLNGNPWKGTSNANGADTKAATGPQWGAPPGGGSGVIIFPRSNDNYGAHRQTCQNHGMIMNWAGGNGQATRHHIVGDDDSFVIVSDFSLTNGYVLTYSGLYNPMTVLSVPYPYLVIDTTNEPWPTSAGNIYGDVNGTSSQQGGIVSALSASVLQLQIDHYSSFATDVNFWPNKQFATPNFMELNIPVGCYELYPQNFSGIMGQIDFVREMFGVPVGGVKSDFSRAFFGSTGMNSTKYSIPWDKETRTVPGSGTTRQGYSFTSPSLPGPLS